MGRKNTSKFSLKKASGLYFVGNIFSKGIGFITIPIFTRIMNVGDYGIITTYNSWVSMLTMIISLALYMSIRASFVDFANETRSYLSVIVSFTIFYGIIASAFFFICASVFFSEINSILVICCLIQALSVGIIEEVSMFFMMKYNYVRRTILMVFPSLLSSVISILVISFFLKENMYYGRVVTNGIIYFVFALCVTIYTYRYSKKFYDLTYIKHALVYSIPLVFHGVALTVLSQADRAMITSIRNSEETAIYGLIYNFSMIATVITNSLDGIWIPWFTQKMGTKEYSSINELSVKYVKLMMVTLIGVIFVAPEVLQVLAPTDYWDGVSIIPPIVLSNFLIFLYTMYVNIEHYCKKTIVISINSIIAALINIALNIFFIRKWGYIGAAFSTLICYAILLGLHNRYARKLNEQLFPFRLFIIPIIIVLSSMLGYYMLLEYSIIRWALAFMILILVGLTERKFIFTIINKRK